MSNHLAISVRNLSKQYTIARNREDHSTLAEQLLARVRHPFKKVERDTFTALRDLNFDVHQGEVVGIVGRNGAGKSTLLKILSRITEPTSGQIDLYGRIGSLLEVGTGFHPELTGRENIYLNGQILGMRKKEIDREFDAIVDFAGVEKFLATPVKRYSSGMYVRLAFAVAAHLQSEILVVDEVLAVGDQEFQRKCLGKMRGVAASGRTVLFVSHHMQSVQVLCNRALFLENGTATYFKDVNEAIAKYVASFKRPDATGVDPDLRSGTGELRFDYVLPTKDVFEVGEAKEIVFRLRKRKPFFGRMHFSCHIHDESGVLVAQCDSRMVNFTIDAPDDFTGKFEFKTPWLRPGDYRVDLWVCCAGVIDRWEGACVLRVVPILPYPAAGNEEATRGGVVFSDFGYGEIAPEEAAEIVGQLSGAERGQVTV
jgi:lipopolysaccharide transport system ATP-binding protein